MFPQISWNNLTGTIPASIANVKYLTSILIINNNTIGKVLAVILKLYNLIEFHASSYWTKDKISTTLGGILLSLQKNWCH